MNSKENKTKVVDNLKNDFKNSVITSVENLKRNSEKPQNIKQKQEVDSLIQNINSKVLPDNNKSENSGKKNH